MSYNFSASGRLHYSPAYNPVAHSQVIQSRITLRGDSVRPVQFYLHSDEQVEQGHLVEWTGSADNFLPSGNRSQVFSESRGHEHALTSVQSLSSSNKLAGVVLEVAATESNTSYKHAGVHTTHMVKDHVNVLRVLRHGCVLAWLLDAHENQLDGVYTIYKNGTESGQSVVRSLGKDHFTIEELDVDVSDRVTALENKLNALTT